MSGAAPSTDWYPPRYSAKIPRLSSLPSKAEFDQKYRNKQPFIAPWGEPRPPTSTAADPQNGASTTEPATPTPAATSAEEGCPWADRQCLSDLAPDEPCVLLRSHDNTHFLKLGDLCECHETTWREAVGAVFDASEASRLYARIPLTAGSLGTVESTGSLSEIMGGVQPVKDNCGIWVSSPGCTTPLHYDLCHGFLFQARGCKKWLHFPPSDYRALYPNGGGVNPLSSRVVLEQWYRGDAHQRASFPSVAGAEPWATTVRPGEVLYTPPWWWHWVLTSDDEDATTSVSLLVPFDPDAALGECSHPALPNLEVH